MKTILHIDDDENILNIVKLILRNENYIILSEKQASNAFDLALKHRPDLIILDIMMPEINGYELLSTLRSHDEIKNIPILILSVVNSKEKSLKFGATSHLTKPVNIDQLSKVIHQLTSNSFQYKQN